MYLILDIVIHEIDDNHINKVMITRCRYMIYTRLLQNMQVAYIKILTASQMSLSMQSGVHKGTLNCNIDKYGQCILKQMNAR